MDGLGNTPSERNMQIQNVLDYSCCFCMGCKNRVPTCPIQKYRYDLWLLRLWVCRWLDVWSNGVSLLLKIPPLLRMVCQRSEVLIREISSDYTVLMIHAFAVFPVFIFIKLPKQKNTLPTSVIIFNSSRAKGCNRRSKVWLMTVLPVAILHQQKSVLSEVFSIRMKYIYIYMTQKYICL